MTEKLLAERLRRGYHFKANIIAGRRGKMKVGEHCGMKPDKMTQWRFGGIGYNEVMAANAILRTSLSSK